MSDETLAELQRAVGRIEGKLDGVSDDVTEMKATVVGMDSRLRHVEVRSAAHGAVAGGVMAVGIAMLKSKMGL